ncbi:MAG: T9SS type A sorting domain-containing protein [bacterium]|jgi:hypothetical protein
MRSGFARLVIAAAIFLVAPSAVFAAYDFDFTVYDYATEVWLYEVAHLHIRIENTGTEMDTVDLEVVDANLPVTWFESICINGSCPYPAYIILNPGQSDTVDIDVYVGEERDLGTLKLKGTSRGNASVTETTAEMAVFCAQSSVLLVDDDNGGAYEAYLETALANAGYLSHVFNTGVMGRPDATRLSSYWAVFWTTADGDASYLTATDENNMMLYLDDGGNLFLASMDFLSSRGSATAFTQNYLHLTGWTDDSGGTDITGVTSDPIGDGMSFDIGSGPFSSAGSDLMNHVAPADECLYASAGTRGIYVYEYDHKLVFFSFPFENIPTAGAYPNNQDEVAYRVALWFEPQMSADDDIPEMAIDTRQIYNTPNPFSTQTRVNYSINRSGHVRLSVYTPTGRFVTDLVDEYVEPGAHRVAWNGQDSEGRDMGSGIYYYRLVTGDAFSTGKMILLR